MPTLAHLYMFATYTHMYTPQIPTASNPGKHVPGEYTYDSVATSTTDALATPGPIQVTEAARALLSYQVPRELNNTARNFIGGLHVTRFGVPMVVVYTRVPASEPVVEVQSVVPGAEYHIEVWGVSEDNTRRSQEPGRQTAMVEERSKLEYRHLLYSELYRLGYRTCVRCSV